MKMNFVVRIRPTLLKTRIRRELRGILVRGLWFIEDSSECQVIVRDAHNVLVEIDEDIVDTEGVKDHLYDVFFACFDRGIECDADIEVELIA